LLSSNIQAGTSVDYNDANCEAAYLFDEGSGTILGDSSGNNIDGSFKGSGEPAWDSSTPPGGYAAGSLLYDGDDDRVYMSELNDLEYVDTITVTIWQKLTDTTERQVFVNNDTQDTLWYTKDEGGNNKQNVYLGKTTSPGYHNSDTALTANSWQHCAFTYNGSNVVFYLDGVNDGGGSTTGNIGWNWSADWTLGTRRDYGLTPKFCCDGYLSETAIFSRVLNSTEINDIMDNGLAPVVGGAPQVIGTIITGLGL